MSKNPIDMNLCEVFLKASLDVKVTKQK